MISLNRKPNQKFTLVSDKYLARAYAGSKVGEQYLVKLLWHGEDPTQIPFDALPGKYVIKTNHASKQIIIVDGPADRADIIRKLSVWLKSNHYWSAREYQYFHIKPKIMIEEYLRNQDGREALDYRFWCFNGVPEVIQVDNHAHDINPFFDTKWNQLDLYYREGASRPSIERPANLEQMNLIASHLSANFDFVRIDLYNIDGEIYFGEFTLTPTAGELKLRPESWNLRLGEKWRMSQGNEG
jgi:TupA-like ATPgrasp